MVLILVLVKFFVLFLLDESSFTKLVKINTDGVARGYPGLATCGNIFRGSMREFIGVFSAFLEVQTVMVVEFYGVIHVMEEAQKTRLTNVWVECDSPLVCATFTTRTNVPYAS